MMSTKDKNIHPPSPAQPKPSLSRDKRHWHLEDHSSLLCLPDPCLEQLRVGKINSSYHLMISQRLIRLIVVLSIWLSQWQLWRFWNQNITYSLSEWMSDKRSLIKVSWTAKKYLNIPMTAFLHCEPSIGWVLGTNHYYAGLAQWLTHTSPPRMPIVRKSIHRESQKNIRR